MTLPIPSCGSCAWYLPDLPPFEHETGSCTVSSKTIYVSTLDEWVDMYLEKRASDVCSRYKEKA